MTRPKADRQQTMHLSGPKAATTPVWRWSGRSSCGMANVGLVGTCLDQIDSESEVFHGGAVPAAGGVDYRPELDDIFHAALHQRARLRQDQKFVDWQA